MCNNSKNCVEIKNLSKTFIRPTGEKVIICDNLDLNIEKGEISSIIGSSGCGKTTLLNMIAGFENYDGGEINLAPNCKIGILFQNNVLFPWKTIMENILFACRNYFEDPKAVIREYLAKVGLSEVENCYPNELSGGMNQRIALLRILLTSPDLIILDEAFGALDYQNRHEMQNLFLELHKERKFTALVVTHDMLEAITLGDNIFIFYDQPLKYNIIQNNVKSDGNYSSIIKQVESIFSRPKNQEFMQNQ